MTVICCICQEAVGERNLSQKKVATSFVWRNHGLCPGCFDRARVAIARAYEQPGQGSGALLARSAMKMANGSSL
jgi:hypothetical protein